MPTNTDNILEARSNKDIVEMPPLPQNRTSFLERYPRMSESHPRISMTLERIDTAGSFFEHHPHITTALGHINAAASVLLYTQSGIVLPDLLERILEQEFNSPEKVLLTTAFVMGGAINYPVTQMITEKALLAITKTGGILGLVLFAPAVTSTLPEIFIAYQTGLVLTSPLLAVFSAMLTGISNAFIRFNGLVTVAANGKFELRKLFSPFLYYDTDIELETQKLIIQREIFRIAKFEIEELANYPHDSIANPQWFETFFAQELNKHLNPQEYQIKRWRHLSVAAIASWLTIIGLSPSLKEAVYVFSDLRSLGDASSWLINIIFFAPFVLLCQRVTHDETLRPQLFEQLKISFKHNGMGSTGTKLFLSGLLSILSANTTVLLFFSCIPSF